MCCYTKEETGFGGRVLLIYRFLFWRKVTRSGLIVPGQSLVAPTEICAVVTTSSGGQLWPRPWRRSPCNNVRRNAKLRGFRRVSITLMYLIPWVFRYGGQQVGTATYCFQWQLVHTSVYPVLRYNLIQKSFFAPMSGTLEICTHKAHIHTPTLLIGDICTKNKFGVRYSL